MKLLLRAVFYPVSFFVEGGLLQTNRFTNCSLIMVCRGIVVDSGKFCLVVFGGSRVCDNLWNLETRFNS